MRASRWGSLAGGACVVALGLSAWLAWEDLHRAPDETVPTSEHALGAEDAEPASRGRNDPPSRVSEAAQRASQQHYLSGMIFFQKSDYAKARDEWALAVQLDGSNSEAKAGLAKLESLYGLKAKR